MENRESQEPQGLRFPAFLTIPYSQFPIPS